MSLQNPTRSTCPACANIVPYVRKCPGCEGEGSLPSEKAVAMRSIGAMVTPEVAERSPDYKSLKPLILRLSKTPIGFPDSFNTHYHCFHVHQLLHLRVKAFSSFEDHVLIGSMDSRKQCPWITLPQKTLKVFNIEEDSPFYIAAAWKNPFLPSIDLSGRGRLYRPSGLFPQLPIVEISASHLKPGPKDIVVHTRIGKPEGGDEDSELLSLKPYSISSEFRTKAGKYSPILAIDRRVLSVLGYRFIEEGGPLFFRYVFPARYREPPRRCLLSSIGQPGTLTTAIATAALAEAPSGFGQSFLATAHHHTANGLGTILSTPFSTGAKKKQKDNVENKAEKKTVVSCLADDDDDNYGYGYGWGRHLGTYQSQYSDNKPKIAHVFSSGGERDYEAEDAEDWEI